MSDGAWVGWCVCVCVYTCVCFYVCMCGLNLKHVCVCVSGLGSGTVERLI